MNKAMGAITHPSPRLRGEIRRGGMGRGKVAALAFVSLLLAVPAFAADAPKAKEKAELADLLGQLPDSCLVVVGAEDVRVTLNVARYWTTAPMGETWVPAPVREQVAQMLKATGYILSGPGVVAWFEPGGALLIGPTGRTQDQVRQAFEPLAGARMAGDLIAVGPIAHPTQYAAVRDGLFATSDRRDTLEKFLKTPVDPKHSLLASPAGALFGREPVKGAAFFACLPKAGSFLREFDQRPAGQAGVQAAIIRRLLAAAGVGALRDAPLLIRLEQMEDAIELRGLVLLQQGTQPPPAVPDAARGTAQPRAAVPQTEEAFAFDPKAAGCLVSLHGTGADFGALVDWWGARMDKFDPDVGAEFREKMAEYNRDFKGDFQREVLAPLGDRWMIGLTAPAGDQGVQWIAAATLRDRDQFLKGAAKFAAASGEPWAGAAPRDGAARFLTRSFTVPFQLWAREDMAVMGASERDLARALKAWHPADRPADAGTPGPDWSVRLIASWQGIAQVVAAEKGAAHLARAWSALPSDAGFTAEVARRGPQLRLHARVHGLSPDIAATWLKPLVEKK